MMDTNNKLSLHVLAFDHGKMHGTFVDTNGRSLTLDIDHEISQAAKDAWQTFYDALCLAAEAQILEMLGGAVPDVIPVSVTRPLVCRICDRIRQGEEPGWETDERGISRCPEHRAGHDAG